MDVKVPANAVDWGKGPYVPLSDFALLAAENERLRDALGEIANWCGRPLNIKCNECGPGHWPHCHELVMIARKAMEGRDGQ